MSTRNRRCGTGFFGTVRLVLCRSVAYTTLPIGTVSAWKRLGTPSGSLGHLPLAADPTVALVGFRHSQRHCHHRQHQIQGVRRAPQPARLDDRRTAATMALKGGNGRVSCQRGRTERGLGRSLERSVLRVVPPRFWPAPEVDPSGKRDLKSVAGSRSPTPRLFESRWRLPKGARYRIIPGTTCCCAARDKGRDHVALAGLRGGQSSRRLA